MGEVWRTLATCRQTCRCAAPRQLRDRLSPTATTCYDMTTACCYYRHRSSVAVPSSPLVELQTNNKAVVHRRFRPRHPLLDGLFSVGAAVVDQRMQLYHAAGSSGGHVSLCTTLQRRLCNKATYCRRAHYGKL